jgi:hypothetical protein
MRKANLCKALGLPLAAACILLLSSPSGDAQTGFASVNGTVVDATGAAIVKAVIKAVNQDTGVAVAASTDASGVYNIVSLIPGNYRISAQQNGFETANIENVALNASQMATVNITLKLGKTSETITVSAEASLLTPTSPMQATTVNNDITADLPYPERSTLGAALLVAGVIGNPFDAMGVDTENPGVYTGYVLPGAQLGISGAPPGRSVILVDGSDVTQASFPRAGISVSGEMIQEMTVAVGGIPAQYGRTMGGAVIQATRGGTNQYHGALTWRHTDPGLNAYPDGGATKSQNHQNFFGGYVGGPVVLPKIYNGHNKTFFYVGVEPGRLSNTVTQQGRVPTPDELKGDFNNAYALINTTILSQQGAAAALTAPRTGAIYYQSPLNANGFPSGARYSNSNQYVPVPNNNLSAQLAQNPLAQYLLAAFPTPSNPGPYFGFYNSNGLWLNNGNNVYYLRGVSNVDNRFSFRVDHTLTERDRLFVRYTDVPLTSGRFFGFPPSFPGNLSPSDQSWAKDVALNETHVISASMVNEVRLMYMRNHQSRGELPSALSKDWGADFGLTPATAGAGFPQFVLTDPAGNIFNGPTFGNAAGLQQVDENYQFSDDVTWTRGRHTIKFGADIRRLQSNQINMNGIWGGNYNFASSSTNNGTSGGTGIASLILGLVNSYTATPVEVPNYYRWHYYAGFLQDDYRLRTNLTLNLGVRYEIETPRIDKYNHQGTFIPSLTGTLNGMPVTGAFCFSGSCGLPTSLWPTNYTGVEPRIGVAWSPTSRMTVRSSFNLVRVPLTGYANSPIPNFNVSSNSVGNTTGGVVPNQPVDIITNRVAPLTSVLSTLQGGGPFFSVLGVTVPYINQTDVTPYAMQWGVTLQYQLDPKTMVAMAYNGLRGVHLITNFSPPLNMPSLPYLFSLVAQKYNFNNQIPNPYKLTNFGSTAVNNETAFQALMPYQNFYNQALQEYDNRAGGSIYNALYINATHRMGYGLSIQASVAWSKSIDNTGGDNNLQSGGGAYATSVVQNPYNLKAERSVSGFDLPFKFTTGYLWEIPVGRGKLLSAHNRVIDAIFGHWTTSGTFNTQSGQPFSPSLGSAGYWVSAGGGTVLPTGLTLRPDIEPGVPCVNPNWESNPFGQSYINQNIFSVPGSLGAPALGDAPRTLPGCRSPHVTVLNASLRRTFRFGKNEKRNLSVGLEGQNALNHPVYYLPGNGNFSAFNAFNTSSITNTQVPPFTYQSSFGYLSMANTQGMSRVLQVSVKLHF